ncbi:MAG: XRE family transcriptional regulator, partial [Myxococcales bacterium]
MTNVAVADDGREQLAAFLRDRRGRLDPTACGFARGRRRTPGLRREEVAQLAGVSVTWYTWLEQGREEMGVPSADVLEGIAAALRMDRAERDHLFLLAHGRPPPRSPAGSGAAAIPPSVRQLVDGIAGCPVLVRTSDTWDVIAWNHAAQSVFGDYAALPPDDRNLLRRVFSGPTAR